VGKLKGRDTWVMKPGQFDTLKKLQEEWNKDGIVTRLDVVDGVKHDSRGVHSVVESFFRQLIREYTSSRPVD
jgi:hypothetical protein